MVTAVPYLTHYGLLAEEVAAVYPELVTRTATGHVQTVKYQELIPMLLNELQRQQRELAELRARWKAAGGAERRVRRRLAELVPILGEAFVMRTRPIVPVLVVTFALGSGCAKGRW